jgi:hypothetical protein
MGDPRGAKFGPWILLIGLTCILLLVGTLDEGIDRLRDDRAPLAGLLKMSLVGVAALGVLVPGYVLLSSSSERDEFRAMARMSTRVEK